MSSMEVTMSPEGVGANRARVGSSQGQPGHPGDAHDEASLGERTRTPVHGSVAGLGESPSGVVVALAVTALLFFCLGIAVGVLLL
jgi:hypothetical protein